MLDVRYWTLTVSWAQREVLRGVLDVEMSQVERGATRELMREFGWTYAELQQHYTHSWDDWRSLSYDVNEQGERVPIPINEAEYIGRVLTYRPKDARDAQAQDTAE
jgi:hypothetical protein